MEVHLSTEISVSVRFLPVNCLTFVFQKRLNEFSVNLLRNEDRVTEATLCVRGSVKSFGFSKFTVSEVLKEYLQTLFKIAPRHDGKLDFW